MERKSAGERFRVVIAGGGVAALEAALALQTLGDGRLDVELVAPEPRFWYRPSAVGEPFGRAAVTSYSLTDLAARAGASFTPGAVVAVDSHEGVARTSAGSLIPFDALLIACGARPMPAVAGAVTFRGPADTPAIEHLLAELGAGDVHNVVFVVPAGMTWSLPLYELALMTGTWVAQPGLPDVELTLMTPEDRPLALFGGAASDAVAALLAERGVGVHTGGYPVAFADGLLAKLPDGGLPADRVVALPRLQVPPIAGVPQTHEGFVPVDVYGRVPGLAGVWAAGDVTTFPVKQGGIAAQQADTAAQSIAAAAGVRVVPTPFRPVLRGLLLTGAAPRFLRGEPVARGEESIAGTEPLWWPPAKIVGRHLAPFLAGLEPGAGEQLLVPAGAVAVDVALDEAALARSASIAPPLPPAADEPRVEAACLSLLVVDPDDSIADAAEQLLSHDRDSAVVVEDGDLIGILTATDLLHAVAGRIRSSQTSVREWMTAEPVVIDAHAGLEEASLLLRHAGVSRLVVVEDGRPVGIVSEAQLARHGAPAQVGLGF